MSRPDVVDAAAGLAPDHEVAALRRQRPEFVRHTQGSYDVLIAPPDPGGISLAERAAVALRVAAIERDAALIAHYRSRLRETGADAMTLEAAEQGADAASVSPRLAAILRHVTRITAAPRMAAKTDLDSLRAVGLHPRDIVVITQIVAFVSYQIRIVAGLRLLAEAART